MLNKSFTRFFFFIIFSIFTIVSCQKELTIGYFDLKANESELYYQETQCADPWYDLQQQEDFRDKSKEEIVKIFLRKGNIPFLNPNSSKCLITEISVCIFK